MSHDIPSLFLFLCSAQVKSRTPNLKKMPGKDLQTRALMRAVIYIQSFDSHPHKKSSHVYYYHCILVI